MPYNKPFAEEIQSDKLCDYGCGTAANYKFRGGKVCCSKHHNSCPGKRKAFSDTQDHKANAAKSLATRTELGITKKVGKKLRQANIENGHYKRLAKTMRKHWAENPWQNNPRCPLLPYKETSINYQGTYEYEFLEMLEEEHGIEWVKENVRRGPSLWYMFDNEEKLYISDFLIGNTIYEIKSGWTWNKRGKDPTLESQNKAKLNQCLLEGYSVKLILDGEDKKW